ncbi:RNA-directed DNA methylation 4 [Linum grandiflorum]
MATVGESSCVATNVEKPVVVRVKRKLRQSAVDAFWLEISEPPSKRMALDLATKLSLSDSTTGRNRDEPKTRKVLVQHVETTTSTTSERKRAFKTVNKREQILSKSRLSQQETAKTARYRQIWSSRKENNNGKSFYDVVLVDAEEVKPKEILPMEDKKLLSSYLSLLREFVPDAAEEIEAEIGEDDDEFVYDYYTVNDSMEEDVVHMSLPVVQVEDEDFDDGPDDESEYGSEDSNAENYRFNEYHDESSEEGDDELQSEDGDGDGDDDDDLFEAYLDEAYRFDSDG